MAKIIRKTCALDLQKTEDISEALQSEAAASVQRFVPGIKLWNDALISSINKERKPGEKITPKSFKTEYGRGVRRKAIKTREELDAVKRSLREPKKKTDISPEL